MRCTYILDKETHIKIATHNHLRFITDAQVQAAGIVAVIPRLLRYLRSSKRSQPKRISLHPQSGITNTHQITTHTHTSLLSIPSTRTKYRMNLNPCFCLASEMLARFSLTLSQRPPNLSFS